MKKFDPTIKHPMLQKILAVYEMIEDCIAGGPAVKSKGVEYLPMPDPENTSEENLLRYQQYLERAIFYNITGTTINSLVGMAFSKPMPFIQIPENQIYILDNIDGSGVSLEQQARKLTGEVLGIGRAGLWADYSKDKAESQEDIINGNTRAVINLVNAKNIVWAETKQLGVNTALSLVIMLETYLELSDDGYRSEINPQVRILKLNESNVYEQEIWRVAGTDWVMVETFTPTDSAGVAFDHIPFTFVGSENNDIRFDHPPAQPIAELNIGHYRNSADNEEASFIVGQPTVAVTGLTQNWVKEVLKGVIRMGSRGGLPLPEGSTASLLQADPNTMPAEGMRTKEAQMAAIGAQLVTDSSGSKTATEINRNTTMEDSTLMSVVNNVEQAYQFCFDQIGLFTGAADLEITLNREFGVIAFDPATYLALLSGTQQGVSTKEDLFNYQKASGLVAQDIEYDEWLEKMENTMPPMVNIAVEDNADN